MRLNKNKITKIIMIILMVVLIAISSFLLYSQVKILYTLEAVYEDSGEYSNMIKLMGEIDYLYKTFYIGDSDVSSETRQNMVLTGFSLGYGDKYGGYMSPEEWSMQVNENKEHLVGIGIRGVFEKDRGFYIQEVYQGSPAYTAGIKEGDYIVKVDNISYSEVTRDEFIDLVRGEEGTQVNISVLQNDIENSYNIIRADVKSYSVSYKTIDNIGYIAISKFTDYTDEEFIDALDKLKSSGIEKYIIDLRDNLGGVADTVISMLDYMIPDGLIVEFRQKDGSKSKQYFSDNKEFIGDVVVLINNKSASASELFAQVLKDYKKAVVLGETSYGKGTVITTFNLSNGGSITLSSARYKTISGVELEGVGVEPDIEVVMSEEDRDILYKLPLERDNQLQKAIEVLNSHE